jgi:hypothetical protein
MVTGAYRISQRSDLIVRSRNSIYDSSSGAAGRIFQAISICRKGALHGEMRTRTLNYPECKVFATWFHRHQRLVPNAQVRRLVLPNLKRPII